MAFRISELQAAGRSGVRVRKSLDETKRAGGKTAFLCHSHADRDLAIGVVNLLQQAGWDIYVDWADATMPETPNRQTAENIKGKIRSLNLFFFLATPNSVNSRWCPWEIGYADGTKVIDSILIIQTQDGGGRFYGNEYLQLYRRLDRDQLGQLKYYEPGAVTGRSPLYL